MELTIQYSELGELLEGKKHDYKIYETPLINLANTYAHGTRPIIVGQLSDLIHEFDGETLADWKKWYRARNPKAINNATNRIFNKLKNDFCKVIKNLERETVKKWVEDLVFVQTFAGLLVQEPILIKLADKYKKEYRLSTAKEESKGIDGYIGNLPVSIKPITYKNKKNLKEKIHGSFISYQKSKEGIIINYIEKDFK